MFRKLFEKSDPAKRYKELKKMSKENLISLFKQKNNVVNTKGVPKMDMISDILNQEFSRKEIDAAFNEAKGGFEHTHAIRRDDIKKLSKMKGYSMDVYDDVWAISKDGNHIGDYKLKTGKFRTNIDSRDFGSLFGI